MNPKWLKLAGEFLELAAEKFSNHGCNDWEWPDDWSDADRREFEGAAYDEDGDEIPDYDPGSRYGPPDWLVMSFLAGRLKGSGE